MLVEREKMNSVQLLKFIHRVVETNDLFKGVYAKDELQSFVHLEKCSYFIIVNSDYARDDGKHWVLFFYDCFKKEMDFFDSSGNELDYYGCEFWNFVMKTDVKYCNLLMSNIQPLNTVTCGFYCLFFAFYKCCTTMNFEQIVNVVPISDNIRSVISSLFNFKSKLCVCNFPDK